ncbi:chromate transporter [Defluviitalea raffinosedens]|jgi:chromate transporter|uniref:Chromate transporter n=1 Tax=Defluviitalea raffinosedens TaxID=1450156 RepID=A0A7C8LFC0_9FIRM|nr:chromate transporter [Defluviitalea raffinosedens]KAE9629112.1 chromate transporter [Defluviitalea raffinosedens]MBM7687047.1 chromate transporter [Defluviitalea raffinosedens]MBZ4667046.1 chrA4 [Defluviitaleaceae bacterium]HHW68698.1 chromate transporter [Candidatus Epulonipiscium sp.]
MIYFLLFIEFFKIGLFAIGGGLATLPFLQELIEKYHWFSSYDLINMIAISESTPGPIGINTATFVGYKTAGIIGSIIATLGIVTPSIIIIILIAHYYMKFSEHPVVRASLNGIRPVVIGLIAAAGFEVAKIALLSITQFAATGSLLKLFNFKAILLFAILLYFIIKYKKHPILYIIGAGILGIFIKF